MDLASPAVSGTSVYANGLIATSVGSHVRRYVRGHTLLCFLKHEVMYRNISYVLFVDTFHGGVLFHFNFQSSILFSVLSSLLLPNRNPTSNTFILTELIRRYDSKDKFPTVM